MRPEPRLERRQWAVAHEIGEHVAYRVFLQWGVDPRETAPKAREAVANNLAGRLLLPTAWFAADGAACGWDLLALKARYRTASHELIARRMLECRPPVIISIFDHRRISFRRSNFPAGCRRRRRPRWSAGATFTASNHPLRTDATAPAAFKDGRSTKKGGSGRFCGWRWMSTPLGCATEFVVEQPHGRMTRHVLAAGCRKWTIVACADARRTPLADAAVADILSHLHG